MTRQEARNFVKAVVTLRSLVTDEQAVAAAAIYPVWKEEHNYFTGDRILYNNVLYKVLQPHVSQSSWTPESAPSLFAKILNPDENIIPEWEQPDSTNAYMTGDKVTYEGETWVSIIDNNVWAPNTYGWEKVI